MIACETWDIPSERVTTREGEFPRLRSRAKSCYSRHSDYVSDNLRICSWSRANSETENSYFSLWHHPWWASCTVISWRSFLSIISISSILECRAIDKNDKMGQKNFGTRQLWEGLNSRLFLRLQLCGPREHFTINSYFFTRNLQTTHSNLISGYSSQAQLLGIVK